MPTHRWTEVDAGIFHSFCHSWTHDLHRALNGGLLPPENYALVEHHLASRALEKLEHRSSAQEFYLRKQNSIAIRHIDGDRLVALVELVSPGNKSSQSALGSFVEKAVELLSRNIHLVIVDLFPPGPRDPDGIPGSIWQAVSTQPYKMPESNRLTLAAYEAASSVSAFIEHPRIGDPLQSMPLFLGPHAYTLLPLEATYNSAFAVMPRRWRDVLAK
jgi:hypothetical protein